MRYKGGLVVVIIILIAIALYFFSTYTGLVIYKQEIKRVLPEKTKAGDNVKIQLRLDSNSKIIGVSEIPPTGWEISEISHEGILKEDGTIEWLFYPFTYFDKPVKVSYKIKFPDNLVENAKIRFSGRYYSGSGSGVVEGDGETIMGDRTIYKSGVLTELEKAEVEELEEEKEIVELPTTNLIAHYKFESDVNDYSGNGRDGTLVGDAKIENKRLILDGSGDYVEIGDIGLEVNANMTITAWYLFNQTAKQRGLWVMMNSIMYQNSYNNYPYFSAENDNNDLFLFPVSHTDVWYYIAITCSGDTSTCRLVNIRFQDTRSGGELWSTRSVTIQPTPADSGDLSYDNFRIGDKLGFGAANSEFKGQVGSFRIYDKVLSYDETMNIYNLEKDKYFFSCKDEEDSIYTASCAEVKDSDGIITQYCDECVLPTSVGGLFSLKEYSCVPVGNIGGGNLSQELITCDYGCVNNACVLGGSCSGPSCSEINDSNLCESARCHSFCIGEFPADFCSQYNGISIENYNNCVSKSPFCEWYGPTPSDPPADWENPDYSHECEIMADCWIFTIDYGDIACDDLRSGGYCTSMCEDNYYPALGCSSAETISECEAWGCTWTVF